MPLPPPITGWDRPGGTKNRLLVTLIQTGSLLATAWMVWWAALAPRLHRQSLLSLIGQVLLYTFFAWAWSATVTAGLYAIVPLENRSNLVPDVLRTAATAVWFGPAMILLSHFSLVSLLPALILVVYASRLLYAQWQPALAALPPAVYSPREAGSFEDCQLPQVFVWRERLPALAVALCLQGGAVAVAGHYPLLGAALFCSATAVLTVFSMATGAADAGKPPTLPKSFVGILATLVLASLMTLGRGGPSAWGFGTGGSTGSGHPSMVASARAVLRQLFYGETPGDRGGNGPARPTSPQNVNTGAYGGFPGVIIWPEIKPVVTLIAPMPALGSNPFEGRPAHPLSIPFDGEYWLFRWPFAHPPSSSYKERGTPSKLAFSTTDHTPLQMEAHQKLETAIDVRCCRGIQMEILNADRYPGTLRIELWLMNSEHSFPVSQSMGSAVVTSHPDTTTDEARPVRETLEFAMPPAPSIEQFNEFRIVFHRAGTRMDKSAKVSVERFILLPR